MSKIDATTGNGVYDMPNADIVAIEKMTGEKFELDDNIFKLMGKENPHAN